MNSTIIQSITPEELSETIRKIIRDELSAIRPNDPELKFLSRDEVCKLLKISLPTLNEYTKMGIIKGSRVGSRILYSELDIQQAVREIPTMKYRRR
jgi:excisionase family DNA binding protein